MMSLQCIACNKEFTVSYKDIKGHNDLCPKCQRDQDLADAEKQIRLLQGQKDSIFPGIKTLKSETLKLELAYTNSRAKYENLAALFERLDKEQAELTFQRQLLVGEKKITKAKYGKKKAKSSAKSAKKKALSALNNLDPATRALVLAQLNKEQAS